MQRLGEQDGGRTEKPRFNASPGPNGKQSLENQGDILISEASHSLYLRCQSCDSKVMDDRI
jgi:hypothetical protein